MRRPPPPSRPSRARALAALALAAVLPPAAWGGSSSLAAPTVTFASAGSSNVSLEVCNGSQCSTVSHVVQVLDPTPRLVGAPYAAPGSAEVGELVHLASAGAGKPPLSFGWEIRSASGALVAALAGDDVYWDTTGFASGVYTATVKVGTVVAGLPVQSAASAPLPIILGAEQASSFYTVPPCRVVDTRQSTPIANGERRDVLVGGVCGIPAGARAIAANVTALAHGTGHLALFPGNYPTPVSSVVTFSAGQIRASLAVLPLATDDSGVLAVRALLGGGSVDLILDVSGYYAPP